MWFILPFIIVDYTYIYYPSLYYPSLDYPSLELLVRNCGSNPTEKCSNIVLVDDYSELNYPSYIGDDNNPIERDPYKPTRIK